jgi:thioredoxin-like negative regulator of GroEL
MTCEPAVAEATPAPRPRLVFFHSPRSGRCRRAESHLAQVLQRRRNHDSFQLLNVSVDDRPDLARRFRIAEVPTLIVIENKKVVGRIVRSRGCRDLEAALAPWLH